VLSSSAPRNIVPKTKFQLDAIGPFYCNQAPLAYLGMPSVALTVVETPQFVRQAGDVRTEAERQEFVDFIARDPEAGYLIPEMGGVRKVRWRRQGMGKRGGVG
jgi:hypothetical protein